MLRRKKRKARVFHFGKLSTEAASAWLAENVTKLAATKSPVPISPVIAGPVWISTPPPGVTGAVHNYTLVPCIEETFERVEREMEESLYNDRWLIVGSLAAAHIVQLPMFIDERVGRTRNKAYHIGFLSRAKVFYDETVTPNTFICGNNAVHSTGIIDVSSPKGDPKLKCPPLSDAALASIGIKPKLGSAVWRALQGKLEPDSAPEAQACLADSQVGSGPVTAEAEPELVGVQQHGSMKVTATVKVSGAASITYGCTKEVQSSIMTGIEGRYNISLYTPNSLEQHVLLDVNRAWLYKLADQIKEVLEK